MKKDAFVIAAVFTLILPAHAAYKMGSGKPVKVEQTSPAQSKSSIKKVKSIPFPSPNASKTNPEADALKSLSTQFDLSVERLHYFRELNYGYEEIVPALVVAREAQIEVGKVLEARIKGKTWAEIAQSLSVDLEPLNAEALKILEPLRETLPKDAMTERPQTRK